MNWKSLKVAIWLIAVIFFGWIDKTDTRRPRDQLINGLVWKYYWYYYQLSFLCWNGFNRPVHVDRAKRTIVTIDETKTKSTGNHLNEENSISKWCIILIYCVLFVQFSSVDDGWYWYDCAEWRIGWHTTTITIYSMRKKMANVCERKPRSAFIRFDLFFF